MSALPLSGIKVLDMARVLAGPSATQLLADLGADVIKIERPGKGDDSRIYGPPFLKDAEGNFVAGASPMYMSANRGKRSVALDIASPEGQEVIRRLAADSDVLVENFKVGNLARYGLDYENLRQVNPRLIYCSVTGFGQTGPYKDRGGYDPIAQAMSGFMSITGFPDGHPGGGGPMKAGPSVADLVAGLYAANAIQAALYYRDANGGEGQYIDISLLDTTVALVAQFAAHYFMSGEVPARVGVRANGGTPGGGYKCADGDILIAPGSQALYEKFCDALGLSELKTDPRFVTNFDRVRHRKELTDVIEPTIEALPVAEMHSRMVAAGIPSSPVNDIAQVFADAQVRARGLAQEVAHPVAGKATIVGNPIRFSVTPVIEDRVPPMLGQHTREVLRERLGMSDAELDVLLNDRQEAAQ